jgi:hypothetical protein
MVSLLIEVIVITAALSLLFSMRNYAEVQATTTAPRQISRRAADYLSYFAAGASDFNNRGGVNNPNAIVTYYNLGTTATQASYDNLTGSEAGNAVISGYPTQTKFGDVGTDILTLAAPVDTLPVRSAGAWPGNATSSSFFFNYTQGCGTTNNNVANLAAFKTWTGAIGSGSSATSPVLLVTDSIGGWNYFRITQYTASNCAAIDGTVIQVAASFGQAGEANAPGGNPVLGTPITLIGGMRFVSFRVRTSTDAAGITLPRLEQKQGLFNPATDAPGTAFAPILDGVEDLQIAWLFNQAPVTGGATIYNSLSQAFPVAVTGKVPSQQGVGVTGGATVYDVGRIAGLRMSVVGRSEAVRFTSTLLSQRQAATVLNMRPAVENRAAGTSDGFDHTRTTTTMMIRNRMLGS